jgi:uncharacterized membrane protein (TIGR02234 family)
MTSRHLAFGCLFTGAVVALIASSQPWWRASGEGLVIKIPGTQATAGLSQALAIVALAGTLLLLALHARGRRLVGASLLLVGIGLALVGGLRLRPTPETIRSQVHELSLMDAVQLSATVWPWVFALSGVLIAAGAAMTLVTAGSWPARSGRFQPSEVEARSDDPAELWKAMDAGIDPTQLRTTDIHDRDTPTATDPKMRDRGAGDTMDGTEEARQLPWSPTSHIPGHVQQEREA